jgi:hypothetical protein
VVASPQSDILLVGLQNKEHAKELRPSYYKVVLYTAKDITQKSKSLSVTIFTVRINLVMLCKETLAVVRIKANT